MFTNSTALRALLAGAGVVAAGVVCAATASADDSTQRTSLGGSAELVDGGTVQRWAVTDLRPSSDAIDYAPAGTLWEATATNTSVAGGNLPFVPGFSARGGEDAYPVLWYVATPEGVNPAGLAPGQAVTGKLYFDVTGAAPASVAFGPGGSDKAVWVVPPPVSAPTAAATSPYAPQAPVYSPPAPAGAPVAPAAPKAGGSRGTPIAQASAAPAGPAAPASPSATAPATPASATPSATAPATPSATAPAGGGQGTPITPTATPTATPNPAA